MQVSANMPTHAAVGQNSDFGTSTSEGMPVSKVACRAGDTTCWQHMLGPQGPALTSEKSLSKEPTRQPLHLSAQQQSLAAEGFAALSLRTSLESCGGQPAMPAAPSLQSWAGHGDTCALASKSASLDASSAMGAASPTRVPASPPLFRTPPTVVEPEQAQRSRQQLEQGLNTAGEQTKNAQQPHIVRTSMSDEEDKSPAFWEGRRGGSASAAHVHGSSAALNALAQAYSRGGQGGPGAAQDAQIAASERSPMETSELLRVMKEKIDSQDSFDKLAISPSPKPNQDAKAAPEPTPGSGGKSAGSKGKGAHSKAHLPVQPGTVFENWPSTRQPAPANPFAKVCEQSGWTEAQLAGEPSSGLDWAGLGSPLRDADTDRSMTALSTCCEAGSSVVVPAQKGPAAQDTRTAGQGRSNAHSSPDSWNGASLHLRPASAGPRCKSCACAYSDNTTRSAYCRAISSHE